MEKYAIAHNRGENCSMILTRLRLLARLLRRTIIPVCQRRPPDFVIGGADNPYMLRWWVIPRNKFFNVYLHQIVRDDDDRALHDHPWASLSIVLVGAVREYVKIFDPFCLQHGCEREHAMFQHAYEELHGQIVRDLGEGHVVWRGTRFAHRLELPDRLTHAWTLFITGPRVREWGFWCRKRWVPWQEFCETTNYGNVGRGCGEDA